MIRRFVSGLVWGGVVAFAGLAVISQVAPHPADPTAPTGDAAVSAADLPADVTDDATETSDAPAPETADPAADAPAAPDVADVATADATAPDVTLAPPVAPDSTAPAAPVTPGAATDMPAAIASEPSPERSDAAVPQAAAQPDAAPVAGDPPPPPPVAAEETDLLAPLPETAAPAPQVTETPVEVAPEADAPRMAEGEDDLTAPDGAKAADPAGVDDMAQADAPQPVAPESATAEPAPQPKILTPETPDALPGEVAEAMPGSDPLVGLNDLPQVGAAPAETLPTEILPDDLPPIAAFARPFDNPEAKPLFAILLVDDGTPALDRKALAELPFPVSFVVDPNAPNAAEAAAIYRAGLQEVVMAATGLPKDANPGDVEQSFGANATNLPETVAVVDLAQGGFQDNRALASAIVPILQDQGRGLITYDRGLNAADQVARRDALPAAKIFRVLDGENESGPTMRRYLDRAAFKAAQEGKVVVIGQAMPDTVAAILEWSVEGRAASVAIAPISAVLQAE